MKYLSDSAQCAYHKANGLFCKDEEGGPGILKSVPYSYHDFQRSRIICYLLQCDRAL